MRRLLVFAAMLSLCACHRGPEHPRTLRLIVAADSSFRARPNWRDVLAARVRAVSAMYSSLFGISLEVSSVAEWNLDAQLPPESKRRQLLGFNSDGNAIFLGLSSPVDGPEPGVAVPFDARVLVFDFPAKNEEYNQIVLAHELAHMFGAWHSPDAASLMHLPPGSSFDSTARECIRLTSAVDFRQGIGGAGRATADQVVKLWSGSHSDPESNPVLSAYLFTAQELMSTGHVEQSMEPLFRAVELAPGNAVAHYMLGSANMALKQFAAAATDFRKVAELSPKNVAAWNNLGGALLQSGQPEQAIPAFRKALEIGPPNTTIQANIATALIRTPGRLDEGIAEFRDILKKNPGEAHAQAALDSALQAKQNGRK